MYLAIVLWRAFKIFQLFLTSNIAETFFYKLPSTHVAGFLGQWYSKRDPKTAALALPGNLLGVWMNS